MSDWEGAELCFYINGESQSVDLSNIQFAVVAKILGLEIQKDGAIQCFSDDTLRRFVAMKGNPLRLRVEPDIVP